MSKPPKTNAPKDHHFSKLIGLTGFPSPDELAAAVVGCNDEAEEGRSEELRELVAERERRGAHDALYVSLNPLSDKGLHYAREHGVVVVDAAALASLFQRGWLS